MPASSRKTATRLSIAQAVVTALGDLTATFTDAGNYTLLFEPADGSADQSGSNTYSVNETANVLTLNATSPQTG